MSVRRTEHTFGSLAPDVLSVTRLAVLLKVQHSDLTGNLRQRLEWDPGLVSRFLWLKMNIPVYSREACNVQLQVERKT